MKILFDETKKNQKPCDPRTIYQALSKNTNISKLLDGRQHDAHEFLKLLIGNESRFHSTASLTSIFMAATKTEFKCLKCETSFYNNDDIGDFIVNVQGETSVDAALGAYFQNEVIERFQCVTCMESGLASKIFSITKMPQCLLVVLNRRNNRDRKLNTSIDVNRELVLKSFDDSQTHHWRFKLASIINHTGIRYNEGHYTTIAFSGETIYKFDDSVVQKTKKISGRDAYILFYERVEVICFCFFFRKYDLIRQ